VARSQPPLTSIFFSSDLVSGNHFEQRRNALSEEQEQVLEQLRELGVDPTGTESEEHPLTDFCLSRPHADAVREPMERLVPV